MKYGGENRPNYLRRRHLDRLAEELRVKSTLVRRRADAMIERVTTSTDAARRALPAKFQAKQILDEIIALTGERCERLAALSASK